MPLPRLTILERLPKLKLPHLNLGRRGRLAVKIGGYVLLGFIAFLFALQMTFPYDRVKDKFVEALSGTYDVTVGDVSRGIMPGKFTMTKVTLLSRPSKPDEPPQMTRFDEIEVDFGVLSLLRGAGTADFEVAIGGGTVEGEIEVSSSEFELSAVVSSVQGDALPQLKSILIGLPLVGKIDASLSFALPKGDWRQAVGSLTLGCHKACNLGDGKSKAMPKAKTQRSQVMVAEGIEFGTVRIDKLSAKVELKGGKLELTKWDFVSQDGEVHVDLLMKLGKRFKESEFQKGCFRFKSSPALQQREAKTAAAIATLGGVLGPDGLFHISLQGRYSDVKAKGRVCSGDGAEIADKDRDKPGRPTLLGGGTPGADDVFVKGQDAAPGVPPAPAPAIDQPPDAATAAHDAAGAGAGSAPGSGTGSGSGPPTNTVPPAAGAGPGSVADPGAGSGAAEGRIKEE